jgi:MFS family permease
VLIVSIRVRRSARSSVTGLADDQRLRAGVAWLRAEPILVTLAAMFTVTNLGLMFGQGIFVKYASVELGLDSVEYGLLLAITAMGAASGGLVGHRVIGRLGLRASVVVPFAVFGPANIVIGLAPAAWIVGAVGFVLGFAITTWNVATVTVRQRIIPGERFGRVNAVYRWLGAAASATGVGVLTIAAAVLFARPVLAGLADT